jgi:hypothetical protein
MTSVRTYYLSHGVKTDPVGSLYPDINAAFGARFVIAAVETSDTLRQPCTGEKWAVFSREAARRDGYFIVFLGAADSETGVKLLMRHAHGRSRFGLWLL